MTNWMTHPGYPWQGGSTLIVALHRATTPAPLKVSTELSRLYTGFYSALLDLPELNLSFHGFCGSTLGTSGIVDVHFNVLGQTN